MASMALIQKNIRGIELIMEKRELAPSVFCYMVSMQRDPALFPMIYKKEFGGWFFVDKMTLLEFVEREKEISDVIEEYESKEG
jgi:hypothetical protein